MEELNRTKLHELLLEFGELLFGHEFTVEEGMANNIQRVEVTIVIPVRRAIGSRELQVQVL